MDKTICFAIISFVFTPTSQGRDDAYGTFINSQMSFCMQRVIKPTKQALPGAGGFVHCRNSIGKCMDDMLYCRNHKINSEVTENISIATVDIIGFCGQIDVHWKPPEDRTNLYYMARTWNISLQPGYSINITVFEFELEYSEECMLDHMRYDRLFPGSPAGMIQEDFKLWGRLCGKRSKFFLYSYNNTAQISTYLESPGILYIEYGILVGGKVKGMAEAHMKRYPLNIQTQEILDGYYLKLFRENSYFWFIKGDIRARVAISYKTEFTESKTAFYMSIIDGPPLFRSMGYQFLLAETHFHPGMDSKLLSGKKTSTGFMALVGIHKLWKDRDFVPVIIEYEENIPEKFTEYTVRDPVKDDGLVKVKEKGRVETKFDITDQFGIWHLHFHAPKDKYISIVIAVNRRDTSDHRELGAESQHCTYSGFAVYNDSSLLGNRSSLGPFCGKWWSPSDSWIKNGRVDWSQAFVTSAQNTINLVFYRYYDPGIRGKVELHILARTEDCPGELIPCRRKPKNEHGEDTSTGPVVKFRKCKNIYVYLYQTTFFECSFSIVSSDTEFIEVRQLRMTDPDQARRAAAHIQSKPLDLVRRDCGQKVELQSNGEPSDPSETVRYSPRQLDFEAKTKECTLSDIYARFFLASSKCRINLFLSMEEFGKKVRSYSDVCGRIGLPPSAKEVYTLKFEIHNPDVEYYTLRWTTGRCNRDSKTKIIVYIHDDAFEQVVTIRPKNEYVSQSRKDIMSWNTGGNHVKITVMVFAAPNKQDCPITFRFFGNKKYMNYSMQWNSEQQTCVVQPDKFKEKILEVPVNMNNMTWREAEKNCQKQGGHLLSIESQLYMHELLFAPVKGPCKKYFNSMYSASMIYIGLHDLITYKNYWWTSCEGVKFEEWRDPRNEMITVVDLNANASSIFEDSFLRDIWMKGKREPSSNRKYRCSAMIMLSPNMDPVWIKIPCDHRFSKARAVCSKSPASKKTCSNELPKPDEDGNDLRKPALQWDKNVTCPLGWVMNEIDLKCYQIVPFLSNFEESNSKNYMEAMSRCALVNGTMAEISPENLTALGIFLLSMKIKSQYSGIWIKLITKEQDNGCFTLKPVNSSYWEVIEISCSRRARFNNFVVSTVLCTQENIPRRQLPLKVMFRCSDGSYVLQLHRCDGIMNCRDESDETRCPAIATGGSNFECPRLNYKCQDSKQCISWSKVETSLQGCFNTTSVEEDFMLLSTTGFYQCKNGHIIAAARRCDLSYDCTDGSDETDCDEYQEKRCTGSGDLVRCERDELVHAEMKHNKPPPMLAKELIELYPLAQCALLDPDMHPCDSLSDGCFKKSGLCVADKLPNGYPAYCPDETSGHLQNCTDFVCPGKFKCENTFCIPLHRVCDKKKDCPNWDDELNCDQFFCNGSFWCDGVCLSSEKVCDGINNCVNGDDEFMCDMLTCPDDCECIGHAIDCTATNISLIPNATSDRLKALFFANNHLKDSSMEKLGTYSLHYLLILDLSHNKIENIDKNIFSGKGGLLYLYLQGNLLTTIPEYCFQWLTRLKELKINKNPIHTIQHRGFFGLRLLTNLDLSGMKIRHIGQNAFAGMIRLNFLNISLNRITYIGANVFLDLVNLTHLNLSGNSLKLIDPSTFQILTNLQSLQTDDYKFCCAAPQVEVCVPDPDVFSSCDDLMSSGILRAFIWLLGLFSLLGNIAVVCYRSQVEKPTVLSFLVHNLGIADFMMGIYLLIIAGADAYYRGVYYLHDSLWRSHFVCRIAGFLSMLSSEMSVYVLILITTDRVLTVGLGRRSFSEITTKVMTIMGWVVFTFLSLLPVTNISYFGIDQYIRHGVCFLFNLTEGKVSGWEYATTIFIGFNLFALIYLAVGYSFTFVSVLTRAGLTGDIEVQLARKLALVVLTDCVCWIPPITIGILSLQGQQIDPQVSMWIAVFVFPVNSSLNPFLYTFTTCGKKPKNADDDSDDNGVTQCQIDANKECNSVSNDSSDYEHLGATGGAKPKSTAKSVRFPDNTGDLVDISDGAAGKLDLDEDNYEVLPPQQVDRPIPRVNSADSGIEAFCVEYDSKYSPGQFSRNERIDETDEPVIQDTAF